MKKILVSLLVFVFTMSMVFPAFADTAATTAAPDVAATTAPAAPAYETLAAGNVYKSKTDFSSTYLLGTGNTGILNINFDVSSQVEKVDGLIAFSNTDAKPDFSTCGLIVQLDDKGFFEARNGGGYSKVANVPYSPGVKYHVRVTTDVSKSTYSVYVTAPGKAEVQIAKDFAYRSDAPKAVDLGKVSFVTEKGNSLISIEKLSVSPYEPLVSGNTYKSKTDFSSTYLLGSGNTGIQNINFDVSSQVEKVDGLIAFSNTDAKPDFSTCGLIVQLDDKGFFEARNGGGYSKSANVAYMPGIKYHVRVTTDVSKSVYSVYVTAPGKAEVQVAKDFAYRSDAPKAVDLGKVSFVTEKGNALISIEKLTISPYEPLVSGNTYKSKTDFSSTYLLGSGNTGIQNINFDVTSQVEKVDGLIAYSNTDAKPDFSTCGLIVQLDDKGFFEARNGGGYSKTANVPYTPGIKYHVRVATDVSKSTYSVFVTVPGKAEVQVAKDFAYRSDAPAAIDLGKVSLVTEKGNALIKIENHSISPYEPLVSANTYKSKTDFSSTYLLGSNKGKLAIDFDVTSSVEKVDGLIACSNTDAKPDFSTCGLIVQLDDKGFFEARNGGGYSKSANVAYAPGIKYHVRVTTDVSKSTYSVFVTAPGKKEVQIAKDFAYRSDAPPAVDIGKVSFVTEKGNALIKVQNLKIKAVK